MVGTFKGKSSRLPRVTSVSSDGFSTDSKTFLVDDFAKIQVNGTPGELGDIAVGMRVLVSSRVLEKGDTDATTIYRATRVTARTVAGEAVAKRKSKSGASVSSYGGSDDDLDLYGELIAEPQEWTNGKGKTIFAGIGSVTPGKVEFVLPNGKRVTYALYKLSLESQEKILALTGG